MAANIQQRGSVSEKERFLQRVQAIVDYGVRLCMSDSQNLDVWNNVKIRLQSLSRDIERATGVLISEEEKDELLSIVNSMLEDINIKARTCSNRDDIGFKAKRPKLGHNGTPKFNISEEQLQFFVNYGFSAPLMAETLHTSESTIRRRLRDYDIKLRDGKNTEINDQELDDKVKALIGTNKRIGPNSIKIRLAMDNIHLPRQRVRDACYRVDPAGSALRSIERHNIHRRTYSVAGPNSLWHIDGNHKLVRWGIVVHGGIDGFSRLITFLHASNNNRSLTVYDLFIDATTKHGTPSRIRVDHGGENIDICTFMEGYRGENRGSAIRGKSAHNQRIERLWVDLWDSITNEYYDLFTYMEDSNILDLTCALHVWAFHYVFLPRINKSLEMFVYQYNHHGLSTERSRTPYQLFIQGVLSSSHSDNVSITDLMQQAGNNDSLHAIPQDYGVEENDNDDSDYDDDDQNSTEINIPAIHCPLREEEMQELNARIDPLTNFKSLPHGAELYNGVIRFIESLTLSSDQSEPEN